MMPSFDTTAVIPTLPPKTTPMAPHFDDSMLFTEPLASPAPGELVDSLFRIG
jgi:hypothetical protein